MQPDGYARSPGQPDGGHGARASASQERDAAARAQADHLGVPQLTTGPAVPVPVRRMRLDPVSRCPGGVGRSDGVGSARAGAVHQEHSLGVAGQDHGQGVLDDAGVVPGPAAGDEEAEGDCQPDRAAAA